MNKNITSLLFFAFGLISIFMFLFIRANIYNRKFLEFINGDYLSKIVVMDKNKNIVEYDIEPGWLKSLIGDFRFIYIQTENNLEKIFIIDKVKTKSIIFDIISKKDRVTYNNIKCSGHIIIQIDSDNIEIEYDSTIYKIISYNSNDYDFLLEKEKYIKEFKE